MNERVLQNRTQRKHTFLKPVLLCLSLSLIVAFILTILIPVPVIGMIPFLLALPLHLIWPELGSTGNLVEYGFAWIEIKQNWLWPVFFGYFFIITLIPFSILLMLILMLRRPKSA